ncbi:MULTISPECIES: hypothetical protein [unclassified Pseudomonas]|uniref:hypothetical protein n=1 Tax=unclassified Pseudomonas TaxID=196821 RepID=UPI001EE06F08|nr:hypothetical protein [Pseudomonas sp. MMS21 TM103]MCG4451694.1 hypothetical protein [Pseudomonas sp. MMS21 TM103]
MRVLTIMALVLLLGGCSIRAPGVDARIGEPLRIDLDGYESGHGGGFCPPGLRMQGRC